MVKITRDRSFVCVFICPYVCYELSTRYQNA